MFNLKTIVFIIISVNTYCQTIKGKLFDSENKFPVSSASVVIEKDNQKKVTTADSLGFFRFDNLEVGRYDIMVNCVGYEPAFLKALLVTSGKQSDVQILMLPKINFLEEVTITPMKQEANYVSSHNISVDQTNRYAATWGDPARMAMSFAGVTSVSDESNELVIRGNSPRGLLWMIEGVEVPSPNHFSSEGASGGLVSALNTTTLNNSTFYTGAFPANYGNATSGVFDIRLRKGNNEKRESNINIGLQGIDVGSEGPIAKKHHSSYLINYRFINPSLIKLIGLSSLLRGVSPKFQDLTFKLNFPFKKANLSVWGIGGTNTANYTLQSFLEIDNRANFYASAANLFLQLNKKTSWETILSFSGNGNINNRKELYTTQKEVKISELSYSYTRLSSNLNKKVSESSTIQVGVILSQLSYNLTGSLDNTFFDTITVSNKSLDGNGSTQYLQSFGLWKKRWQSTTISVGVHSSFFVLNNKYTIEPRLSIKQEINSKSSLNVGIGLHSRLETISVYLFKNNFFVNGRPAVTENKIDNKYLDITKSFHSIVGVTFLPNNKWRFNTEIYYQHLFDVGVGDTTKIRGIGYVSLINQVNAVNLYPLVSRGAGENYGWELTVEKSLNRGTYFLFTSSIYKSTFQNVGQQKKPSRFSNGFVFNLLSGKEWQIRKNVLNINLRNTWAGGIRTFPFSMVNGFPNYDNSQGYTAQLGNFFRTDLKISFILNFKKTTSTFSLDINNLTNRENPLTQIYNPITKQLETINQLGLLPVLNYRINF
jgi:hypothetical protein